MTRMTEQEKQTFLADLHVGVLSIPRMDDAPLTVPVWYDYTPGADLWFLTGKNSMKGKLLSVGGKISLCAQTEEPPYRYVSVSGSISSIETPKEEGLPMAVRYLGEEMGRAYLEQSADSESVVVRVRCEKWLAVDYSKINLS